MPRPKSPVMTEQLINVGNCLLTTQIIDGYHHAECDICGTDIQLTITANPKSMIDHRGSERCKKVYRSGGRGTPGLPLRPLHPHPYLHSSRTTRSTTTGESSAGTPPHQQRGRGIGRQHTHQLSRESSVSSVESFELDPPPQSVESASSSTDEEASQARCCYGVGIDWRAGLVWDTYPFHTHNTQEMGWEPIGFSPEANVIILRSNICKLEVDSKIGDDAISCSSCLRLQGSSELRKIMERATGKAASHTPWDFLTVQQMKDILADNAKTMKVLRTNLSNCNRKLRVAQRQLSDFQRILMLLAKNDIPGLRRLLAGGLKRGASPRVLVDLLERAVKGLRTAKGFSERDYDITLIAKALGGPRLLYALQKAYGLPSQTTLRNHQRIPTMLTSVGVPTKDEVKANIQTFFQPDVKPPSKDLEDRCGDSGQH
ncbi:hypothetical protein BKA70DRAFT_1497860 [Coprinopsis sp. MPI-PUGE-AT-0042]|nr:hypothetical protein BKA70DRAFT_1497860 [Coprinopsis sp. MPI-PUGE-AT-0042]